MTLSANESLDTYREAFEGLAAPPLRGLAGTWRAEFVGPLALRKTAGPGLALLGLPGFWGKELGHDGQGINLLTRDGGKERTLPMQLRIEPSRIDGRPSVVIHYAEDAPLPWRFVIDELRAVDARTLLAMSLVDRGPFKRAPLPFLLHRER